MFVGRIGANSFFNSMAITQRQVGVRQISSQITTQRKDHFEMDSTNWNDQETGIYQPNRTQMQSFAPVACTRVEPDKKLQEELLPASEQSSYTEDDALVNQYMKQSRIDGYFDGGTFVCTSSEPVKLILIDHIAKEDLEDFRNGLIENGLGSEIDWQGVRSDFTGMAVGFDNIERFGQKADYIASRYAILKDRIQTQFTGDQQEAELQKLEQLYTEAKEKMANSYAEHIGGFYEDMGQSGMATDMRESVLTVIDGKAKAYSTVLAENDLYGKITAPENQWLKQDDAYMAAQLRATAAEELERPQSKTDSNQAMYSETDLVYAGIYAKELSQMLDEPAWDTFTVNADDSDLGKYLAEQHQIVSSKMEKASISEKLSSVLKNSFEPFIGKFMDALDTKIDHNRKQIANHPWQAGTVRTNYIDRSKVYNTFKAALDRQ